MFLHLSCVSTKTKCKFSNDLISLSLSLFLLVYRVSYLEIDIGARLEDRGELRIGENGAPFASAMFENSSLKSCFFLRCPLLLWCSHSPRTHNNNKDKNLECLSTSCLCQQMTQERLIYKLRCRREALRG